MNIPAKPLAMPPHRFALWLFMVSVSMLFAALTSAYLVKSTANGFLQLKLPIIFWINTGIIVLSSLTLQTAFFFIKKNRITMHKTYLLMTVTLSLLFLVGQYQGWKALVAKKVYFVGNAVGSFVYIFTGLHAVHLVSGMLFMLFVLVASLRPNGYVKQKFRMSMCTTYWHFLTLLWVYLFVFLLFNH